MKRNPMSLEGKRILVTGASSGIGRACAIMASELGATVILTGRNEHALNETLMNMEKTLQHVIVPGDLNSEGFVKSLPEKTGAIDGMVHSAGIGPMCPVGLLSREQIKDVLDINYTSFLGLMCCYSKRKNRNEHLSVVAVSSVSALAGWGGVVAYCGSKGALSASVRALAVELASKKIRVNAVCPSNIRTPMYEAGAMDMNNEASMKNLLLKQPLGLGEPEQVAAPVCFLLSDASSFITGINMPVDGGYMAQ